MKKLTAILICFMLIFSLAACFGGGDKNDMNNNSTNQSGQNDGLNGGGSGGFDENGNSGTDGSMNGNGSMNGSGSMNGNTNGGNGNTSGMIEDLTDPERESLRSRIDAMDGLTFSDIRFEGTKAYLTVKSTLGEIGKDVKDSITDMLKAVRGGITDVEIMY